MTRDEFHSDPWRFLSGSSEGEFYSIRPEWVREAWERDPFRREVVDSFVHSLNKVGSFCNPVGLAFFHRSLTPEQAVDFHNFLRETTFRPEMEWRAEFEKAFPNIAANQPPADRGLLERWNFGDDLLSAIRHKDVSKVKWILRYMVQQNVLLGSVRILDETSIGLTEEVLQEMETDEILRTIESPPPGARWLSAIEFAEFVGDVEIIRVLKAPVGEGS
jgi:hypothetical protein